MDKKLARSLAECHAFGMRSYERRYSEPNELERLEKYNLARAKFEYYDAIARGEREHKHGKSAA